MGNTGTQDQATTGGYIAGVLGSALQADAGPAIATYLAGLVTAGITGDTPDILPPGVVNIQTPVTVPTGIFLVGSGHGYAGGATLTAGTVLRANTPGLQSVVALSLNSGLRSLTVDGLVYGSANASTYSVYVNFLKCRIQDCTIAGSNAVSLMADGGSDALSLTNVQLDPGEGANFHTGQALALVSNAGDLNCTNVRSLSGGKVFNVAGGLHANCHYDGASPQSGNLNVALAGCVLNTTATVTNPGGFPGVSPGMTVAANDGSGFVKQNTQVVSVVGTTMTLTQAVTGSVTETLNFTFGSAFTTYAPTCNLTEAGGQFFSSCYFDSTGGGTITACTPTAGTGTQTIASAGITAALAAPGMTVTGPGIPTGVTVTVVSTVAGTATVLVSGGAMTATVGSYFFGANCMIDRTGATVPSVYGSANYYNNQQGINGIPCFMETTINRAGAKIHGGSIHAIQSGTASSFSYFISAMANDTVILAIDFPAPQITIAFTSNPTNGQLFGISSGPSAGAYSPVIFGTNFVPGSNAPSFPPYTTGTAPAAPTVGSVYYNTTTNQFNFCTTAGTWTALTLP